MKWKAKSKTWQLQEAKAKFSEVVERAIHEGPQFVTRRNKDQVVVITAKEYETLRHPKPTPDLLEALLHCPPGPELKITRDPTQIVGYGTLNLSHERWHMPYLLDTCAISEFVAPKPDRNAVEAMLKLPRTDIFLNAITVGELPREASMNFRPEDARPFWKTGFNPWCSRFIPSAPSHWTRRSRYAGGL